MKNPIVVGLVVVFVIGVVVGIKMTPGTSDAEEMRRINATGREEYSKLRESAQSMEARIAELTGPVFVRGISPRIAPELAKFRQELVPSRDYQILVFQKRQSLPGEEDRDSVVPVVAISAEAGGVYLYSNFEIPGKPGIEPRVLIPKGK